MVEGTLLLGIDYLTVSDKDLCVSQCGGTRQKDYLTLSNRLLDHIGQGFVGRLLSEHGGGNFAIAHRLLDRIRQRFMCELVP